MVISRKIRIIAAAIFGFLCAIIVINFANSEEINSANWVFIPEIKSKGLKAYYSNNIQLLQDNAKQVTILASSESAREINLGGKKIEAKSIARIMIISCEKGVMLPVLDLYYSSSMPAANDKSIAVFEHPAEESNIKELSKKSILYLIYCSTQV